MGQIFQRNILNSCNKKGLISQASFQETVRRLVGKGTHRGLLVVFRKSSFMCALLRESRCGDRLSQPDQSVRLLKRSRGRNFLFASGIVEGSRQSVVPPWPALPTSRAYRNQPGSSRTHAVSQRQGINVIIPAVRRNSTPSRMMLSTAPANGVLMWQ